MVGKNNYLFDPANPPLLRAPPARPARLDMGGENHYFLDPASSPLLRATSSGPGRPPAGPAQPVRPNYMSLDSRLKYCRARRVAFRVLFLLGGGLVGWTFTLGGWLAGGFGGWVGGLDVYSGSQY